MQCALCVAWTGLGYFESLGTESLRGNGFVWALALRHRDRYGQRLSRAGLAGTRGRRGNIPNQPPLGGVSGEQNGRSGSDGEEDRNIRAQFLLESPSSDV